MNASQSTQQLAFQGIGNFDMPLVPSHNIGAVTIATGDRSRVTFERFAASASW